MKKSLFIVGIVIAVSVFALGTVAFAQNFGLDETAGSAGLKSYGSSVPTIAGNVIGTLLSMISVLFFVLVLYGGILYMTARGSSETTEKAINTIIAATIGIIIIIGAYALTNFVFKLGGAPQTSGGGGNNPTLPAGGSGAIADACGVLEPSACVANTQCEYVEFADNSYECKQKTGNVCGNGIIEQGEECDGDSECTNTCTAITNNNGGTSVCGNEQVEPGEQCDGGDFCSLNCDRVLSCVSTPDHESLCDTYNGNASACNTQGPVGQRICLHTGSKCEPTMACDMYDTRNECENAFSAYGDICFID